MWNASTGKTLALGRVHTDDVSAVAILVILTAVNPQCCLILLNLCLDQVSGDKVSVAAGA